MKKIDVILALITGEGVAGLFIWLLKNSPNIKIPFNIQILYWLLLIVFPILALFCLWLAYLIGKKYLFVYQLAKFLLIGAVFAIFDLIILNLLLEYFGIKKQETIKYMIFVGTSFVIATSAKYVADKYWAFEKKESKEMGKEFFKFFLITVVSGGIQIMVASFAFSLITPLFGLTEIVGANVGKILGIAVASAWNFLGYKFIVFKK